MKFFFEEDTLDDLMMKVLTELLNQPFNVTSTRGVSSELIGCMLHLTNPLARLSRSETKGKVFSAIGELLWYLSGDNDLKFISYYLSKYDKETEDGSTIYGGYGPRLFRLRGTINQFENIINLLKEKKSSRKAVIQIFDGNDLSKNHPELPCTCTLQFIIREDKMHMYTSMRSNDAFLGLPHDIFAFTMIQELLASTLGVGLGKYTHSIGSMHLYQNDIEKAILYKSEGYQSTYFVMPPMPKGDPWPSINTMLKLEKSIRNGQSCDENELNLDPYWQDIIRMLKIFRFQKDRNKQSIKSIQSQMSSPVYNEYIEAIHNKIDKPE